MNEKLEVNRLRSEINDIVELIYCESVNFRTIKDVWRHLKRHFGRSQELADMAELRERKRVAEEMLEEVKAELETSRNSWPEHHTIVGPEHTTTPWAKKADKGWPSHQAFR